MRDALQFAQKLAVCLSGPEITLVDNTDCAFLEHFQTSIRDLYGYLAPRRRDMLRFRRLRPGVLYEFRGFLGVVYLAFMMPEGRQLCFIGPVLTEPFSEQEARSKARQLDLPRSLLAELLAFTGQLPVVSCTALFHFCSLLMEQLDLAVPPIPQQTVDFLWQFHPVPDLSGMEQKDLPQMRRVEARYELGNTLTEAVKHGNFSLVIHLLSQQTLPSLNFAMRNRDPLRNAQNSCIIVNTQLRYALEDCGIHPYRLDQFSHQVGLQIEKLTSPEKAQAFLFEIIRRYCHLAQEGRYPNKKPLIRMTINYIKEHLSDNLTVKETARALSTNANYLSTLFHRDMGMTFIEFVNRERIEQAADLLKHSNLQIQQIAAAVGFNSTSYFAKQFLRYYGKSPRAYRAESLL